MKIGMAGRLSVLATLAVLVLGASAADARAQAPSDVQVLLTPAQALVEVFPAAASYRVHEFVPSTAQRTRLEETLGRRLFEPRYAWMVVYDARNRLQGYALVTDERGKYRPI